MSTLRQAAQQALEALEYTGMDVGKFNRVNAACAALRAALAEPEQEPVAWVEPKWLDPDTRGWPSDSFESVPIEGWLPLYTAPTPRKPLMDEKILTYRHMIDWTAEWSYIDFARAIERAHGIGEQT